MSLQGLVHVAVSLLISVAVPMAVYLASGNAGAEIIVLGVILGLTYWYWGPSWPPV